MNYGLPRALGGAIPCPSSYLAAEHDDAHTAVDLAHTYLGHALQALNGPAPTCADSADEFRSHVNGLLDDVRAILEGQAV